MNPILFQLGPIEIRYYGILMALGFLIGYFILKKLTKDTLTKEQLDDYFVYLLIGIILGARLFEVFVYEPTYYLNNLIKIFYVWEGGLASHGGMLGGIISTLIFCYKKKIKFYTIADIVVIPIALGAMFVRIGNFINGEIVGRVTTLPWGMKFDNYKGLRHPSQLYEAFKNLLLFFILLKLHFKKLKPGILFWTFIGLFSTFRFIVEFWKDWPLYFNLTIGQLLSIPLIILSGIMIYYINRSN